MSNIESETEAQRQIKSELAPQKETAQKHKRRSSQVESSGKRQRLGNFILKLFTWKLDSYFI